MIPQSFARGDFDGVLTPVLSEIVDIALYDLARSMKSVDEKTMESQLDALFKSLHAYRPVRLLREQPIIYTSRPSWLPIEPQPCDTLGNNIAKHVLD